MCVYCAGGGGRLEPAEGGCASLAQRQGCLRLCEVRVEREGGREGVFIYSCSDEDHGV